MYQQYMSKAEYDEIAAGKYNAEGSFPHCDPTTFHRPKTCPFCDGYYTTHRGWAPLTYAPPEGNGWGGNMAPIVDDDKAAEEAAAMGALFSPPKPAGPRRIADYMPEDAPAAPAAPEMVDGVIKDDLYPLRNVLREIGDQVGNPAANRANAAILGFMLGLSIAFTDWDYAGAIWDELPAKVRESGQDCVSAYPERWPLDAG